MDQLMREFTEWLMGNDKGNLTIRTYVSAMKGLFSWLGIDQIAPDDLQAISTITLLEYRSYLVTTLDYKPTTVNKIIAGFKAFFMWAHECHYVSRNPASTIRARKIQQNVARRWLSDIEIDRLLLAIQAENNQTKRARDLSIVLVMLQAGLRVSEVSDLQLSHIDWNRGMINVVNGKGFKFRAIPMHRELQRAMRNWIKLRRTCVPGDNYVFTSERSPKMTTRAISHLLDRYYEQCGLLNRSANGDKASGPSCHSLRHTFCKRLIDAGAGIQQVAQLAGHESIQTTCRYTVSTNQELGSFVDRT